MFVDSSKNKIKQAENFWSSHHKWLRYQAVLFSVAYFCMVVFKAELNLPFLVFNEQYKPVDWVTNVFLLLISIWFIISLVLRTKVENHEHIFMSESINQISTQATTSIISGVSVFRVLEEYLERYDSSDVIIKSGLDEIKSQILLLVQNADKGSLVKSHPSGEVLDSFFSNYEHKFQSLIGDLMNSNLHTKELLEKASSGKEKFIKDTNLLIKEFDRVEAEARNTESLAKVDKYWFSVIVPIAFSIVLVFSATIIWALDLHSFISFLFIKL